MFNSSLNEKDIQVSGRGSHARPFPLMICSFFMIAISLLVPATEARCQDTLCIHFNSQEKNMHMSLESGYSINGRLPLTICDIRPGETWELVVNGRGMERRRGFFEIGSDGNPSVRGNRLSAMMRNAVMPGWGSMWAGRKRRGLMDLSSLIAVGTYYTLEEVEYRDMKSRYEDLEARLAAAETTDERSLIQEAAHTASRALNVQNEHRKRVLILAAAMYGYQLIDPLLSGSPPRWKVEAGGSIVQLGSGRERRAKAFLQSLIWPGKGQLYQGKKSRGFIFSAASAAAAFYTLDRMNSYDEHVFLYEVEIEKWQNAVSLEKKDYYRDRASLLWDSTEDARRERNTALYILAGIWTINLVDTFFPLTDNVPLEDFSIAIDPNGMALVLRF